MKRTKLPSRAGVAPAALLALAVLVSLGTAVEPAAMRGTTLPAAQPRPTVRDLTEREAMAHLLASLTEAAKRLQGHTPLWAEPGPAIQAPRVVVWRQPPAPSHGRALPRLLPQLMDLPPPIA